MHIEAYQKLTLLDFPEHTAATVFTYGCNFRCPFCHNATLVTEPSAQAVPEEEFFAFLEKRKGLLDGVCITGGEPTLQHDLEDFIRKIRALGYAVKLDTNGTSPEKLERLLNEGLVDYVAMDIKNSPERYGVTAGIDEATFAKVRRSAALLLSSGANYEFRTTVTGNLHTEEDMVSIGKWIGGAKRYFLQQFKDSGNLVGSGDFAVSEARMHALLAAVKPYLPCAKIRGEEE